MSMFLHARRSLRAVAVTGALAMGVAVVSVPAVAQADTPGCVTKREFRKVHNGMSKTRIHRILDTRGKQSSIFTSGGDRYESREYRSCRAPSWSMVSVDYENNRVSGKFAYWG